jgi:NAD(P)-dependent dehydrogenase (short-subunit alcohol dehydrogenase family)
MALTHFNGAVVVITGGASGIGFATAQESYARGAKVVLADINARSLQQAVAKIRQQKPDATDDVLGIPTDVTAYQQVQALMQQAVASYGRIDLVVASAGIAKGGTIDTFSVEGMRAMMDINFMGVFHCVKAAIPTMRHQQSGYFVFLSSVAGKLGSPTLSGYCASKWAVRGFATSLRVELYGSGIGITTVYPAFVDTPMFRQEVVGAPFLAAEALLKPEQVANEILQAVTEEKHDLTLAPNPDIAKALLLMKEDPDKAEMLMGKTYRKQLEHLAAQNIGTDVEV